MEDINPGEMSRNEPQLLEDVNWDLKFQNLWSLIIAADSDFKTNMTLSEKIFYLVGQYNHEVNLIVTRIVNDLSLAQNERLYQPETSLSPKNAVLLDQETHDQPVFLNSDQMIYLIKGILIKICPYGQAVNPGAKS